MKLFRGCAIASASLAFALAILGSWVRVNDAGLTCPDWPLCRGELFPALADGVVLEWSHRLLALIDALAVVGTLVTGLRVRKELPGAMPVLGVLAAILVAQIILGGATVLLDNSPASVMLHWATGMALVAALTSLAVMSLAGTSPNGGIGNRRSQDGMVPVLAIATAFAFATMCAGAYVAASHAGLACPGLAACGASLRGATGAQFAQMVHRLLAASFTLVALVATAVAYASGSSAVRRFACTAFALVLVQVVLGLANIVLRLPPALREAHAANAAAVFVAFVIATVFAALEPATVTMTARGRVVSGRAATHA